MHELHISVPDEVFAILSQRAKVDGFESAEQYVADYIAIGHDAKYANLDHLFTPEVIAHLDSISARIDAGEKTYSMSEIKETLSQDQAEWLKNQKN